MADGAVDEIIGQAGIDQVSLLDAKFDALNLKLVESAKNIVAVNVALGDTKKVKEFIGGVKEMNAELAKITKLEEETALIKARREGVEMSNDKKREQRVKKELDDWDKLILKHKEAERKAQNLSQTIGIQSKEFKEAALSANKYLNEIKAVDFTLGNARRNVGNYSSAVFSLSQVFREMPAFAYDAKMGLLAIGNNLPILADEFIRVKNDAGGAMKAIGVFARSIFTFTNIFTIAIGVFTIFYDEIMKFIRGTNTAKESIETMNKALTSGAYVTAIEQLMKLKEAIILVKEKKVDAKDALNLYNTTIGETIGKVKSWEEAEDNIMKKGDLFIEYMKLKTQATALYGQAAVFAAEAETVKSQEPGGIAKTLAYLKGSYFMLSNWGKSVKELNEKSTEYLKQSNDDDAEELKRKESIYEETANKITESMAKIGKALGVVNPLSGAGKADKGTKAGVKGGEINREQELEEDYKAAILKAKQYQELHLDSEVVYREKLLKIIQDYTNKKSILDSGKLSENERNTSTSFGSSLLSDLLQNKNAIEKYYAERIKAEEEHDKSIAEHAKNLSEEKKKAAKSYADLEEELWKNEQAHINNLIEAHNKEIEAINTKRNALNELLSTGIGAASDVAGTFADRKYILEIQAIEERDKKLTDSYNNELRFIEQSGLSVAEKEKRKQKLEAETEAKRKKIDKDRADAAKRQAKLQKAITIATIIAQTAQAVMVALADPLTPQDNAIQALIAGAAGAAQLIKVLATPLPQYAKGRKGGQAEYAVVSEQGQEAMRTTDGKISLLPKTKSIVHLPQGADVIPHHELIKNAAYVHLAAQGGTITTDRLQTAMIDKFDELIEENRQLKKVLIGKSFSVFGNSDNTGFENWKNSKIK